PTLLALQAAGAQVREPTVARTSIWIDTVKRGDMVRQVRALGQLVGEARGRTGALRAVLKVPAAQATDIKVGQAGQIDTRRGRVAGTVAGRSSATVDGIVEVEIKLSNALPDGSIAGTEIDSTIEIERLQNVLYVGRPVIGSAGRHCGAVSIGTRRGVCGTRVGIIRASLSQRIEIREGLREGD